MPVALAISVFILPREQEDRHDQLQYLRYERIDDILDEAEACGEQRRAHDRDEKKGRQTTRAKSGSVRPSIVRMNSFWHRGPTVAMAQGSGFSAPRSPRSVGFGMTIVLFSASAITENGRNTMPPMARAIRVLPSLRVKGISLNMNASGRRMAFLRPERYTMSILTASTRKIAFVSPCVAIVSVVR